MYLSTISINSGGGSLVKNILCGEKNQGPVPEEHSRHTQRRCVTTQLHTVLGRSPDGFFRNIRYFWNLDLFKTNVRSQSWVLGHTRMHPSTVSINSGGWSLVKCALHEKVNKVLCWECTRHTRRWYVISQPHSGDLASGNLDGKVLPHGTTCVDLPTWVTPTTKDHNIGPSWNQVSVT